METCCLTGKPSVDRPWLQIYPKALIDHLQVPTCTLREYLVQNMPGMDVTAMHYYGKDISWKLLLEQADLAARALKALGFGQGDQIPVFLRSVPEFVYLLLGAEKIGASLLCRDNTLSENVDAVRLSGAKAMIAHDFLTKQELDAYLSGSSVEKVILVNPIGCCGQDQMPAHIRESLSRCYSEPKLSGDAVMDWDSFLALGEAYDGEVDAPADVDRPLFRAYTSGATGPSKQVIHSAHTMLGVIAQLNFYGASNQFRPTWLLTLLPPCLVAVVVSIILMPLASNKLLILDPFCDVHDVDLEVMRYRPNLWPSIPMFIDVLIRNGRVPDDYDMSHLLSSGVGCEALNNKQIRRIQKFFNDHNCKFTFAVNYGNSEAGSTITLPFSNVPCFNGNVGIPMPLTDISIFEYGSEKELGYNQTGEICMSGPGCMLGYDTEESTKLVLRRHSDGRVWLHMGDLGYMDENGSLYICARNKYPRFEGGNLDQSVMENLVADAEIEGLDDEFFVIVPDAEHPGNYLPYLCVVLEDGYSIADIENQISEALEPHMQPVEIIQLPERPFFHFKTNRIGLTNEILKQRTRCGVSCS